MPKRPYHPRRSPSGGHTQEEKLKEITEKLEAGVQRTAANTEGGGPVITRKNQLHFRVTGEELQQIDEKMASLGILKREAYLQPHEGSLGRK